MASNWFDRAKEFMEEAEFAFTREKYWLTCYYAQQVAEFALKGALLEKTGSYLFTHDLSDLLKSLESLVKVKSELYLYADALSPHYTRARYPARDLVDYDKGDAERCLLYARKIYEFATKILTI